ncbi:MAG: hypothetical protein OXB91_11000 [Bryobacterales bacterium]|nr:hypothetical protein [Bryobacterales bacterium]
MKCYGKQIVNIHSTALGNERTRLLGQYSRQLRLDADRFYAVEIARSMADWQWTGGGLGPEPARERLRLGADMPSRHTS